MSSPLRAELGCHCGRNQEERWLKLIDRSNATAEGPRGSLAHIISYRRLRSGSLCAIFSNGKRPRNHSQPLKSTCELSYSGIDIQFVVDVPVLGRTAPRQPTPFTRTTCLYTFLLSFLNISPFHSISPQGSVRRCFHSNYQSVISKYLLAW